MKKLCLFGLLLGSMAVGALGACGGKSDKAMQTEKPVMTDKSLYERLGGLDAIKAVVDDFVANVAADPTINARFASTDVPHFKQMLVDQICEATGGPCKYRGASMVDSHRGMKITEAEFNALVEDLVKSLDKFKVPAQEKNELLTALGSMKPQIVGQ